MIRRSKKLLSLVIVLLMTMSSLIVFPMGETSAATPVPTWQVGDSWAMSGNRNITNLYDQFGDEAVWFYSILGTPSSNGLLRDPESYSNNRTVNYAAMWGNSNSYSLSEVKGETSTSYELKVTTAVNFTVGGTLDYNAEMLAPGSYRSYRSNLPWGSFPSDANASVHNVTLNDVVVNNVVGNGQMRGAMSIVADMTVSKADLSISSMATSTQGYVKGELELKNYPGSKLSNEMNLGGYGASVSSTVPSIITTSASR